jgi:hypothetical protein
VANFVTNVYRNSVIGITSVTSARIDADSDNLIAFFNDDGTVAPAVSTNFVSSYATSETPSYANAEALATVTAGFIGAGIVGAANNLFDGSQIPGSSGVNTSCESYIIAKTTGTAATSPNLVRFDTATGLPLTPNAAAVTVAYNAGGIWTF